MPDDHGPEAFREQPTDDPDLPVSPLRRARLWVWAASILMFIAGLVFLMLPVTVVYYLGDHHKPYDVETVYATRSDQVLVGRKDLDDSSPVVTSVRLGCGTALDHGKGEVKQGPDGPKACAIAERPRTIAGWLLVALGVLGFGAGFALPPVRSHVERLKHWADQPRH